MIQDLIPVELEVALKSLTQDMDPKEVDISLLIERFREFMQALKEADLELYGKFLVFCVALLKVKANLYFGFEDTYANEDYSIEQEQDFTAENIVVMDQIPMISLPIKRKPRIKISIEDLKKALKEALKIELKREERWEKRKEVEYGINLNRADIKKRLEEFFKALLSRFSRKSKIRFEEVLERKDREEKVEKFSNILFLESDKKINCIQKQFLGELLIEIEKSAKAE